jgi:hypothetical protein
MNKPAIAARIRIMGVFSSGSLLSQIGTLERGFLAVQLRPRLPRVAAPLTLYILSGYALRFCFSQRVGAFSLRLAFQSFSGVQIPFEACTPQLNFPNEGGLRFRDRVW